MSRPPPKLHPTLSLTNHPLALTEQRIFSYVCLCVADWTLCIETLNRKMSCWYVQSKEYGRSCGFAFSAPAFVSVYCMYRHTHAIVLSLTSVCLPDVLRLQIKSLRFRACLSTSRSRRCCWATSVSPRSLRKTMSVSPVGCWEVREDLPGLGVKAKWVEFAMGWRWAGVFCASIVVGGFRPGW